MSINSHYPRYVKLETAKRLKEIGFPQDYEGDAYCSALYTGNIRIVDADEEGNICDDACAMLDYICKAPLYDAVMRWFREEKGIDIMIDRSFSMTHSYHYNILYDGDFEHIKQQSCIPNRSWEQALEDAIIEICNVLWLKGKNNRR